jgi:hypothetical protein
MVALGGWLTGGLYLDGWAHTHDRVLETFFTPWHGVLYSGMLASLAVLAFVWIRNVRQGLAWLEGLPRGYGLSLVGALLFGVGGLSDLVWHEMFGIEDGVDALLSPTHLVLAFGGILIVSGPLRSMWVRPDEPQRLMQYLLVALSLTFLLSVFTFFTQFAHPVTQPLAAQGGQDRAAHGEIYLMNADGSGQTRLLYSTDRGYLEPSWSRDGHLVAFVAEHKGVRDLYVRDMERGITRRLTDDQVAESFPVLSPNGSKVAFLVDPDEPAGQVRVLDVGTGAQTMLVEAPLTGLPIAWSPDGSLVAYTSALSIYTITADGGGHKEKLETGMPSAEMSWSPDGHRMVFGGEKHHGNADIYVMDVGSMSPIQLTDYEAFDAHPVWSPDGTKIAFSSRRDGDEEIYVMNADGSGVVNLTNSPGSQDRFPSWSPDGQIVFQSQVGERVTGSVSQGLGVASILLQTALVMGLVLFVLHRWPLPPGALTLIVTLNAALLSVLEDQYLLAIPVALGTGLIGEVALLRLRLSPGKRGALRLFAFGLPVVFYSLYFLVLGALRGIGWPIELWAGSILLAGVVGLLLSYVATPPGTLATL